MFKSLETLLQRKKQMFICKKGWPDPSPPEHVVQIEHQVGLSLSSDELLSLKKKFQDFPELVSFYSKFGSLRLYSQIDADESAYYIAGPSEWDELKNNFTDWVEDLDNDEREQLLPGWISDFVVIGEIPKSGNYFIMPFTSEFAGRIYEFEHDGFEFVERGKNFGDFIDKLTTINDELLEYIRGHIRYQDTRPDSQWLVEEYRYE